MCIDTLRTGLVFLRQSIWGVTCLGLLKKWMFSHLSLWKPINVCWNPQNRARFYETIHLRGHMPRFTSKNKCFPIYLIRIARNVVLKLSEQGSFFWPWLIWGVTWLGLVEKWMFFHLCAWKLHKWVLELSEQGLFFQDNRFEGSHA